MTIPLTFVQEFTQAGLTDKDVIQVETIDEATASISGGGIIRHADAELDVETVDPMPA